MDEKGFPAYKTESDVELNVDISDFLHLPSKAKLNFRLYKLTAKIATV